MESTFDPEKNATNLRKHGVSLAEGDGVLNDPLALTTEDLSAAGEQRFVSIGLNVFGQLRVVVYTPIVGQAFASSRCASLGRRKYKPMKKEYDFSGAKRGAVIHQSGKTRITMYLDDVVIDRFKALSESTGKGYQTLINEALRSHLDIAEQPLTAEEVRRIIREELVQHASSGRG